MHEETDDDEDEETGDDEDEETGNEEATMTVDDNSQPCGEDFNEDGKSAIANVRKEVDKFQEMLQVK